jgi:hypothetical protein
MSSLLGGLFDNMFNRREARRQEAFNRQMIAEQNAYNDPAAIRKRAEDAGYNPLLFVGPGVGLQTSVASAAAVPASAMGSAIADAGMMLGQAFAGVGSQRRASAMNKLAADNAKLRRDLTQQTLRPKIPGQYGPLVTRAGSRQTAAVNSGGQNAVFPNGAGTGASLGFGKAVPFGGSGPFGSKGPTVPNGSPSVDPLTGQQFGVWFAHQWVPRPTGWSAGDTYETEMGETVASEFAMAPLSLAWGDALAKAGSRAATLALLNKNAGGRGLKPVRGSAFMFGRGQPSNGWGQKTTYPWGGSYQRVPGGG